MKSIRNSVLIIVLTMLSSAAFAEVAVIVNSANGASVSKGDITAIFLGKTKKFSDGSVAVPVVSDGAITDEFNSKLLGKTSSQLKSYWSKLVFTGKANPPKKVPSAKVLELIKTNNNMIGFVDSAAVSADVKVVGKF